MHIVHVFPSRSWGGAEIYSLELAARQKREGWSVSFWGVKDSKLINEAIKKNIPVITEELPQRLNPMLLPKIVETLKKNKTSHLHLHWSGGAWAFLGAKFFLPLKIVYHNHMWIKHYKYDPFHWIVYQFVDRMIVAGERARLAATRYLAIENSKIKIVPYGIDLTRDSDSQRKDFDLPSEGFIFGMFSRIDRQKGTKEFLIALESCMSQQNVYGVLVGDATLHEEDAQSYQKEVEDLLSREPLKSRVKRLASRPDYLKVLKQCDVLVVPSYHESYSLLILDAFMLSKPVISTDSGGTPDLVTTERGWLVPPKTVDELAQVMMTVAKDLAMTRKKGERAHEYVLKNHSFDSILEKIKSIYI